MKSNLKLGKVFTNTIILQGFLTDSYENPDGILQSIMKEIRT